MIQPGRTEESDCGLFVHSPERKGCYWSLQGGKFHPYLRMSETRLRSPVLGSIRRSCHSDYPTQDFWSSIESFSGLVASILGGCDVFCAHRSPVCGRPLQVCGSYPIDHEPSRRLWQMATGETVLFQLRKKFPLVICPASVNRKATVSIWSLFQSFTGRSAALQSFRRP
jgi:hypothetical protein